MSRTYSQERIVVSQAYPGKNWAKKVMGMDDQQIHEIYTSIMFRRENERKTAEAMRKSAGKNARDLHAKTHENYANMQILN